MRRTVGSRFCVLLFALAIALVAAGGASSELSVATASTPTAAKPATPREWARIVAAAKREGSVTIYTSQNPTLLAEMAARFKERYGITVTINRQLDAINVTQVTSEHGTGNVKVDLWVSSSRPHALGAHKPENRWVAAAVGPALFAKGFDRKVYAKPGNAIIVGAALIGMGWNTNFAPQGMKDMPDLLNSRLKGRIGAVTPSSPTIVDWYLWVQANYGRSFIQRLAAQEPKIYASSLPMTQAVASGEVAAGSFVVPQLLDLKKQGAPVEFYLPKGSKAWNAPWFAMIMKKAPHPNAAQLVLNYMVSAEGQALANRGLGSVRKGVPGTYFVTPRMQNLKALTPEKVADYQKEWNALFRR